MNKDIAGLQTSVGNINNVLYDTTGDNGEVVPGLITKVDNLYKEEVEYSHRSIVKNHE